MPSSRIERFKCLLLLLVFHFSLPVGVCFRINLFVLISSVSVFRDGWTHTRRCSLPLARNAEKCFRTICLQRGMITELLKLTTNTVDHKLNLYKWLEIIPCFERITSPYRDSAGQWRPKGLLLPFKGQLNRWQFALRFLSYVIFHLCFYNL